MGSSHGAAFLVTTAQPQDVFVPEDLPADARLMAKTLDDFLRREVLPLTERIERQEEGLMPALLRKAGDLGLLAANVPEAYGGLGLPKTWTALLAERAAVNASFAISLNVHSGIAVTPLIFFGTAEQKQRYLPRLATGEMVGAFALSEATAGSDALAAQARATPAPDGSGYLLSGAKMWITNAGFADLFTVFAQGDEGLCAFLVERSVPGVSTGPEEHKLGLKGSSTRRLVLDNAPIPAHSLLGEPGKGRRVALYPLNLGRLQIGVNALGAGKDALARAARYALERSQFGRPIAEFGLIQHKLAEMATSLFIVESMIYRTAGDIDALMGCIVPDGPDSTARYMAGAEEFAIECAIVKFTATEALDYVADEALQIHGGYGFTEDFPISRIYRDSRVNRIFEGTNEINRLAAVDQLLRRVRSGRLALNIDSPSAESGRRPVEVASTRQGVQNAQRLRDVFQLVLAYVGGAIAAQMPDHEEVAGALADIAAAVYGLESAAMRVEKISQQDGPGVQSMRLALAVYADAAFDLAARAARMALAATLDGDMLSDAVSAVRTILDRPLCDTVALRRRLASVVIDAQGYPWSI